MKIKVDPFDVMFSEFIRRRAFSFAGGCEYCGKQVKKWKDLQCSHFIGRRKRATRYDPDNACGVCFSCHTYLGEHPYEHTDFFKKRLGTDRLERLVIKGNTVTKMDRDEVEQNLRKLIEELDATIFTA